MANYTLGLDSYLSDMKGIAPNICDNVNGVRKCRSGSDVVHTISLSNGIGHTITVYMGEAQFYIYGFSNASGVFRFKDKVIDTQAGAKNLGIGCAYVGTQSLGILNDGGQATSERSRESLVSAVKTLASHSGGDAEPLKVPLALVVFLVSESLRFAKIIMRMHAVLTYGKTPTFTFKEFADLVQNWAAISSGQNLPPGTTLTDVAIRQA